MIQKIQPILDYLNRSFGVYNIKGIYVEPRYWMAVALGVLSFLLVLTLARLRYLYIHWSVSKPSLSMIFWGFILALVIEGFLMVFGRTMFTEILGWKNAPKPIGTLLDIGRNRFSQVLGVEDYPPTYQSVISAYERLERDQKKKVTEYICK